MLLPGAVLALRPATAQGGNVDPSPEQAHEWVERELAKPEYAGSLWERLQDWFLSLLQVNGSGGGSISTLLFVVLGIAVAVAVGVVVVRHLRRHTAPEAVLSADHQHITTHDFLQRARHAWEKSDYSQATLEYFRAAATQLTQLGWLQPGEAITTADVTAAVQRRAPDPLPTTCRSAAHAFDQARYGHVVLTAQQAQPARELAEHLLTVASPQPTPGGDA